MGSRRYTLTQKKIETNRTNAQYSTGPRTKVGKLAVRLNAVTHGIFVKEILASASVLGESPEEIESLLHDLWEDLNPGGKAAELCAEEIATIFVRKARVLRAEQAEILHSGHEVFEVDNDHFLQRLNKTTKPEDSAATREELREVRAPGGCLPPTWVFKKTTRYDDMLDRKLLRALERLELLRRCRRTLDPRKSPRLKGRK